MLNECLANVSNINPALGDGLWSWLLTYLHHNLYYIRQDDLAFDRVGLFVCLSVCPSVQLIIKKSTERICKFLSEEQGPIHYILWTLRMIHIEWIIVLHELKWFNLYKNTQM